MPNKFASGRFAIAECDRCAFRYKLSELKTEIIKTKPYQLKVCRTCWDPDQPQLQLGMYPVNDPQAVREPRRDLSYVQSGLTAYGYQAGGSRDTQWGWNPVGQGYDYNETPNYLVAIGNVGTVTINQVEVNMKQDGIVKKGHTKGKNLGDDGAKVADLKGGKKSAGVTNDSLKALGRNEARVANQKKGM